MASDIERAAFSRGVRSRDAEIAALKAEVEKLRAACAEMRAALRVGLRGSFEPDTDGTKLCRFCSGFVSREEQARDIVHDVGCFVERARALLSRPDLDALLKQGGG